MKLAFCYICLINLIISYPAYAYIDPGVGSMFVQAIIAALLVIPFYFKKIIAYIKHFFSKNKKKDTIDD